MIKIIIEDNEYEKNYPDFECYYIYYNNFFFDKTWGKVYFSHQNMVKDKINIVARLLSKIEMPVKWKIEKKEASMTWKEFKERVESAGVKDGDALSTIDLTGFSFISEELSLQQRELLLDVLNS